MKLGAKLSKKLMWASCVFAVLAGLVFLYTVYMNEPVDVVQLSSTDKKFVHTKQNGAREDLAGSGHQAIAALNKINDVMGNQIGVQSCTCSLDGLDPNTVNFEDAKKCGKDRNYFEATLAKMDKSLTSFRDKDSEAAFPRKCLTYVMREQFPEATTQISNAFALCKKDTDPLVRGQLKPCITENYVNFVYNAMADVASCLNVDQKDLMPKLYNESGLQINATFMNADKTSDIDAGLGQMTNQAIIEVNDQMDRFTDEIKAPQTPACKRISAIKDVLTKVPEDDAHRCAFMTIPPNPYRSLIYEAVLTKSMREDVSVFLNRELTINNEKRGDTIFTLVSQAGLPKVDRDRLEKILTTLAYNTGPRRAVLVFNNYVKARLQALNNKSGDTLALDDFDLSKSGVGVTKNKLRAIRKRYDDLTAQIKDLTTQTKKAQKGKNKSDEQVKINLKKIDSLSAEQKKIRIIKDLNDTLIEKMALSKKENKKYLQLIPTQDLTFAEYARIYGSSNYLNAVYSKKINLDEAMGPNVCTADKFLSL